MARSRKHRKRLAVITAAIFLAMFVTTSALGGFGIGAVIAAVFLTAIATPAAWWILKP